MRPPPPPPLAIKGPPSAAISAGTNRGKSLSVNALVKKPITPLCCDDNTGAALHVSYTPTPKEERISVYYKNGRVTHEPLESIVLYTGTEQKIQQILQQISYIHIQVNERFLHDVCLIDLPGEGSSLSSVREDNNLIAYQHRRYADVCVHLVIDPATDLAFDREVPHQQPLIVLNKSDLLVDWFSDTPFHSIERKRSELHDTALINGFRGFEILSCAPLIAYCAESVPLEILEKLLWLAECNKETVEQLMKPASLYNEVPEARLPLSERIDIVSKISKMLVPWGPESHDCSWPFFRFAVAFAWKHQMQSSDTFREALIDFSGIHDLRSAILEKASASGIIERRAARFLIERLRTSHGEASAKLAELRVLIEDLHRAVQNMAGGAFCELEDVIQRVTPRFESEAENVGCLLNRYEGALSQLINHHDTAWMNPSEALLWLIENEPSISLGERQLASRLIAKSKGRRR